MSAQISYSINQEIGYPGLIYAQAPHDIVSRAVETVAGIAFGVVVSRGTNLETQIGVGGTVPLGVTIRSLDKEGAANTGAIKWDVKDAAGVMRYGYVWAICNSGCATGNSVKYNTTTGIMGDDTLFPAGAGEQALPDATWETSVVAGEIGLVRLAR